MLETIMKELEELGTEQTKKTHSRYGAKEPFFGVTVGNMSKLIKKHKLKNNQELALELYDTNNYDAMYLAGLIADTSKMPRETLEIWMEKADAPMIYNWTIGAVGSECEYGAKMAFDYINSDKIKYKSCGYTILTLYVAFEKDENINVEFIKTILSKIEKEIKNEDDMVKGAMVDFIIAVGRSVGGMYDIAMEYAEKIGDIEIQTSAKKCKKANAKQELIKAKENNRIGFKRKTSRCY